MKSAIYKKLPHINYKNLTTLDREELNQSAVMQADIYYKSPKGEFYMITISADYEGEVNIVINLSDENGESDENEEHEDRDSLHFLSKNQIN